MVSPTEPSATPSASEDASLLDAIAQRRDREAFSVLFAKYDHAAYSVAVHITGRHEVAEEAVQEVWLRVWLTAAAYRGEGTVRAWLMGIVAGKSLEVLRAKLKRERHVQNTHAFTQRAPASPPEDSLAQGELLQALRDALGQLSPGERQLVGLHYGAGLSHHEIARALSIPRSTISYRIDEVVQRLRTHLAGAGLAAAVPLLDPAHLCEAVCSGFKAPAGLRERVLSRLASLGDLAVQAVSRRSAHVSARAVAGSKGSLWALASLPLALGAAAGAVWWLNRGAGRAAAPEQPELSAGPAAAAPAGTRPSEEKLFFKRWTFENGPPSDIRVLQHKWVWRPGGGNGSARLEVPDGLTLAMLLPISPPQGPFCVDLTLAGVSQTGRCAFDLLRTDGKKLSPFRIWAKHSKRTAFIQDLAPDFFSPSRSGKFKLRTVMTGDYSVSYVGKEPTIIWEFQESYPSNRLCVLVENYAFEALEVRELRTDELPAEMKDMPALIARMGVQPKQAPGVLFQAPPDEAIHKSR